MLRCGMPRLYAGEPHVGVYPGGCCAGFDAPDLLLNSLHKCVGGCIEWDMNLFISDVEKRLQDRYQKLVQEHAGHSHAVAAGPRLLPDEPSTHAAAMAAWRFYANPRTTFPRLAQPLLQVAQAAAPQHCLNFALVPLDWSKLDFRDHASKTDRVQIGRREEWGYQLLSALLLSDVDGQPLAPLCAQLRTAAGLLSSRFERPRPPRSVLDELAPVIDFVQGLPLGPRPVFVIDAEADSVYHYRQWQRRCLPFLPRAPPRPSPPTR